MAKYWISVSTHILEDRKIASLSDRLWRRWFELQMIAGKCDDGILPSIDSIANMLQVNAETLEAEMNDLKRHGLVTASGSWRMARTNYIRQESEGVGINICSNPQPSTAAVYGIYCTETNKYYIGGSKNPRKRIMNHYQELARSHNGERGEMGEDFQLHGEDAFIDFIIEYVDSSADLVEREQYWIDEHDMRASVYNAKNAAKHYRWGKHG